MSIEIYLPKPHEGQIAAWTAAIEERFHAVCCGRRWGKTVMLVNIATSCHERCNSDPPPTPEIRSRG